MRPRRPSSLHRLLALALAGAGLACAGGEPPSGTAAAPEGTFGYQPEAPAEVQEPLLELSYQGGMIKNPDPTPFVRVYPGGRVLIHYPAYMKNAGDYELQLGPEELDELLSSFADQQVLTVESDQLEMMAAEARAEQAPLVPPDDHGVATVVEIRAESFTPAGETAPTLIDVDRRLVAQDLPPAEALTDPRFAPLRGLAEGVAQLEALAKRSDLRPVEPAPAGGGEEGR